MIMIEYAQSVMIATRFLALVEVKMFIVIHVVILIVKVVILLILERLAEDA